MSERTAFRAVVRGRVHGVGFRYATVQMARRLGLVGWVRNVEDGTVEVHAQGAGPDLDALERWLGDGPRPARVTSLQVGNAAADPSLSGFGVRY